VCRQEVEQCDALIVVVGHRYGWIPSDTDGGDNVKSITWWEVHWAMEKPIPVFAFLVDPTAPWLGAKEQDRLLDEAEDPAKVREAVSGLREFRALLENRVTRELFGTAEGPCRDGCDELGQLARGTAGAAGVRNASGGQREEHTIRNGRAALDGFAISRNAAFTPADEPTFFGRGRETDFLIEQLCHSRCRFLLIHGTSGSGKSSLVAAGLIPRLKAGALPGSDRWLLPDVPIRVGARGSGNTETAPGYAAWHGLRFTPGELGPDPFLAVANKLAPLLDGGRAPREVAEQLRCDERQRSPCSSNRRWVGRPEAPRRCSSSISSRSSSRSSRIPSCSAGS
jgi:hypothetical protein